MINLEFKGKIEWYKNKIVQHILSNVHMKDTEKSKKKDKVM